MNVPWKLVRRPDGFYDQVPIEDTKEPEKKLKPEVKKVKK